MAVDFVESPSVDLTKASVSTVNCGIQIEFSSPTKKTFQNYESTYMAVVKCKTLHPR